MTTIGGYCKSCGLEKYQQKLFSCVVVPGFFYHCKSESRQRLFLCFRSSPPMVLENSSNAHAAGTKSHTDPPLTSSVGQSAQQPEANMSHALDEQVGKFGTGWELFLHQRTCPSSPFLIIFSRAWAPPSPQTQIPVWVAKIPRKSPLLMSGSGRWWRWRTRRVRLYVKTRYGSIHVHDSYTFRIKLREF